HCQVGGCQSNCRLAHHADYHQHPSSAVRATEVYLADALPRMSRTPGGKLFCLFDATAPQRHHSSKYQEHSLPALYRIPEGSSRLSNQLNIKDGKNLINSCEGKA